jgi:hypothetical protein
MPGVCLVSHVFVAQNCGATEKPKTMRTSNIPGVPSWTSVADYREQAKAGWGWAGGTGRARPGKIKPALRAGWAKAPPACLHNPPWRPIAGQPAFGVGFDKAPGACLPDPVHSGVDPREPAEKKEDRGLRGWFFFV